MKTRRQKISALLSGPVLLNYSLPIVMLYLVAGTIAQKYIGLYEATHIFFSSFVFWFGPIPLPGLPVFMALIFINLVFKLVWKSPWKKRSAGIIVTHIGAMLLLLGGLYTAFFAREGYIDFRVGETKHFVTDYHEREFILQNHDGQTIKSIRHGDLSVGDILKFPDLPISIKILQSCRNCQISNADKEAPNNMGMAQHMKISSAPLKNLDEENMAGLTFSVKGSTDDGNYLVLEGVPKHPVFEVGEGTYTLILRRVQRGLPFSVTLLDFKRDLHPGTAMAKSYQSRILIEDGGSQWESLIKMNEPFRYKGYSFFQSSFMETPEGAISVLAVVWNAGRSFPYISGILMCLGLLIHLFVRKKAI